MKYYTRLNTYKSNNVEFNPDSCQAYSYGWWRIVEKIGDKIVFNSFSYSNSTTCHQRKVRNLLADLGINIDVEIECPRGLQDLEFAIECYSYKIKELSILINNPGTRKATNLKRAEQIKEYRNKIDLINELITVKNSDKNN